MSSQTFIQCVQTANATGSALTNTGGPTSILPLQALYTFPPNSFYYVGQKFRVKAYGQLSTQVQASHTLTLALYFGAVIVATTSTMAMIQAVRTNVTWELEFTGTLRAIAGSSSNNIYFGHFLSEGSLGGIAPASGETGFYCVPTSVAVSSNWDNTTIEQVDLRATWASAGAGDSVQLLDYSLELMN